MNQRTIPLPPPSSHAGMDLIAALRLRRSTREYDTSHDIGEGLLSTLLWAAVGVSGPEDKRTAPSAFGGNQVILYIATRTTVFRYDAATHSLLEAGSSDIRAGLCPDEWIGTAPVSLILTGRTDKFPEFVTPEMKVELLQATAGCIAENVHLMAAALGLGTCMVGHMNTEAVKSALSLEQEEIPLYVMPVGYLKP